MSPTLREFRRVGIFCVCLPYLRKYAKEPSLGDRACEKLNGHTEVDSDPKGGAPPRCDKWGIFVCPRFPRSVKLQVPFSVRSLRFAAVSSRYLFPLKSILPNECRTRIVRPARTSAIVKEEGLNLNVRAAMALATYPHHARSPHDIIRRADEMIYMMKNSTPDNIGIAQRGVE